MLLDIADEFVETATRFSCDLARHRGGTTVEARDLRLHLGTEEDVCESHAHECRSIAECECDAMINVDLI